MSIDPEVIRDRYATMADEELLLIDRHELTEAAQYYFDRELKNRHLVRNAEGPFQQGEHEGDGFSRNPDVEVEQDWVETAFPVFTFSSMSSSVTSAGEARDALEAAGIPCRITENQIEPDPGPVTPYIEYQLMVPAALILKATSVLDKKIYNAELAEEWENQLASLSDEELRALDLEVLCGGLLDRVERLRKVYNNESARRAGENAGD